MIINNLTNNLSHIPKYLIFILSFCFILVLYQLNSRTSPLFRTNHHSNISSLYNLSTLKLKTPHNMFLPTRTLVVYVYGKTHGLAEQNLAFFIHTAVRASHDADYYFILQKINNATFDERQLPSLPSNAHYIQHENKCFDIGTVGWFLFSGVIDITKYKYFIFLNSSVRGPYIVSYYDNIVWYTIFTNRLNDDIKLVGCTINCESFPHVQSYLWVLDFKGLDLLIRNNTVFMCHKSLGDTIVNAEIFASRIIIESGLGINSLMKKYQNTDFRLDENKNCNNLANPTFTGIDGISSDPFEVVFVKIKDQFTQYKYNRERISVYDRWIHG